MLNFSKKEKIMFDLYVIQGCPYCQKVIDFMNENNIIFNLIDISSEENVFRLLSLGGREQVPFLNDTQNDVSLYESDDIIEYLKNRIRIYDEQ